MNFSKNAIGIALILLNLSAVAQDPSAWRYSAQIKFNTSSSGANVSGDVKQFPVAITLNKANFNFNQAKPDGSDLRFSEDPAGADLPFSIEHWDPKQQSALVWVKVPLIKGNSNNQSIYIHWGNPSGTNAGNSPQVFDTKEGFVGVWHLQEEGSPNPGHYQDATANAANGTGLNLKPGSSVGGRVGNGQLLRYEDKQWIRIDTTKSKLFDLTKYVTFSIWAYANSYANKGNEQTRALPGYETMIAKGDNSWRLQKFGVRDWHKPAAELIEICVERQQPKGDLCVVGKTDMVTGKWFHITGVHDFPNVKLYVNGVLDTVVVFDTEWKTDVHPVGIGNQSQFPERGGRYWDGILDEARVIDHAKDEHWIKLDYESQREGQRFLTIGKPIKRKSK